MPARVVFLLLNKFGFQQRWMSDGVLRIDGGKLTTDVWFARTMCFHIKSTVTQKLRTINTVLQSGVVNPYYASGYEWLALFAFLVLGGSYGFRYFLFVAVPTNYEAENRQSSPSPDDVSKLNNFFSTAELGLSLFQNIN